MSGTLLLEMTPQLADHALGGRADLPLWDVDFSSALENRTGKYFIGRDLLSDQQEMIGDVWYWRARLRTAPEGARALALKFAMKLETRLTAVRREDPLPPRRHIRRTLHLDPFSVMHARLTPEDIVLIHDMGPVTHRDLFQDWLYALYCAAFERIAEAKARTVFVSRASRDAYARIYGDGQPMSVIYPQIRAAVHHAEPEAPPGLAGPFLLTVGSIGRRKNQAETIRAFARSGLAAQGMRYVLCGAREPGADDVERLAKHVPGVHLLPYVSDGQLAWLYAHARGFVLVSRLEGFGMPVAEAISQGVVPLVTRASVLEEVAGEGALLADCDDEKGIAAGMVRLAAMEGRELGTRRVALRRSLSRFTRECFARRWHEELASV